MPWLELKLKHSTAAKWRLRRVVPTNGDAGEDSLEPSVSVACGAGRRFDVTCRLYGGLQDLQFGNFRAHTVLRNGHVIGHAIARLMAVAEIEIELATQEALGIVTEAQKRVFHFRT